MSLWQIVSVLVFLLKKQTNKQTKKPKKTPNKKQAEISFMHLF